MTAKNTLRLARENIFFGPGTRQLLQAVQKTGSLRKATISMGLSYTKALRMVRGMETELGFAVVESVKGGNAHGGTRLTAAGQKLLNTYAGLEQELNETAQRLVDERFAYLHI